MSLRRVELFFTRLSKAVLDIPCALSMENVSICFFYLSEFCLKITPHYFDEALQFTKGIHKIGTFGGEGRPKKQEKELSSVGSSYMLGEKVIGATESP